MTGSSTGIRVRNWAMLVAGLALWGPTTVGQQPPDKKPARPDFNPVRLAKPFRPIVDAKSIPAADVTDQVKPEELVLGVVVSGQARAYPINMLTGPRREIVNDTLGGRAIAATW